MCHDIKEMNRRILLRGLDPDSKLNVHVREWPQKKSYDHNGNLTSIELWTVKGPLKDCDWMTRAWGGDSHCLWLRVYPFVQWDVPSFFQRYTCPEEHRWKFSDPALVLDSAKETTEWWDTHRILEPDGSFQAAATVKSKYGWSKMHDGTDQYF